MYQTTFSVKNNSRAKQFFSYKPVVVGYYSLDKNLSYFNDLRQLKYVRFPETDQVEFDLNAGLNFANKLDSNNFIDDMLQWITENAGREDWVPPEFVCMRGLLNTLLGTPYEKIQNWMICATRWRGTIYLCAKETDENRCQMEKMRDKQSELWGLKFEQYMCSDEPHGIPDTKLPVTAHVGLRVVFRTQFNSHHLLFAAQMKGVKNKTKIENCAELASAEFVELKTNKEIENDDRVKSIFQRYKLVQWWGKSFLVGVSHIVCGFKDDSGVVHRLQHYDITDLPKMAKGIWDPLVCMSFCDRFLQFVKSLVTEDDPNIVWCFEWKPNQDVTASKILGPSELTFLPPWFISSFPPVERVHG